MMNFFRRKGKRPSHPVTPRDPEFPVLSGLFYIDFLKRYHELRKPEVYLEVGTQKGLSLAPAQCHCISIDPKFQLEVDVVGRKPSLYLYQGTSDDFFASGYLDSAKLSIDFAFLDGMHLFEYLLRDFINTEKHCGKNGAITMHDCVPYARIMAKREWDKTETRSWTGDVWKLIPILRAYRPDLKIEVLDCPPTSLLMVSDLDRNSTVLSDHYDEIFEQYRALTLDAYGVEKFVNELNLVDSKDYLGSTPA